MSAADYYEHVVRTFEGWSSHPEVVAGHWPKTLEEAFGIAPRYPYPLNRADASALADYFMDVYALDMRADLSVTNSDAPDPVVLRANLTYTVTVQNGGPAAAQAVTLTDQLAADAAFVSATPSQGTCARAGKGGREGDLVCALGTIDPFHSATVAIVVKPSRAGTLTNTASVRSGSPDPNAANNAATATTTVVAK